MNILQNGGSSTRTYLPTRDISATGISSFFKKNYEHTIEALLSGLTFRIYLAPNGPLQGRYPHFRPSRSSKKAVHPQHHPLRLLSRPNFHSYTRSITPYGFFPGQISTATPNSGLPKGRHSSPSASTAYLRP